MLEHVHTGYAWQADLLFRGQNFLTMTRNTLAVDFRLALRNILRQRRRSLIDSATGFGVVAMMLASGFRFAACAIA